MAYGRWKNKRVVGLLTIAVLLVTTGLLLSNDAQAYVDRRPQRHFTSQELHNRPEKYRRIKASVMSLRRFDVTRGRVVKLKPSTLWNRRPYQFSTPEVDGNTLYVGVDSGFFYAVGMGPPRKLWFYKAEGPVQAKALADGAEVFFGDCKGFAYSLDAKSGALNWKTQLDAEIMARPLAIGDMIYVFTMSGRLFGLDRKRGVEVWHTDASERAFGFSVRRAADPVLFNGVIYIGTSAGTLFAYREADGALLWARQLGDRQSMIYDLDSTPLFIDDKLYVASADGQLFCMDPSDGSVIWSIGVGGADDMLYHEGRLYVSGGSGTLYALEPSSGNLLWEQDLETAGISSPSGGKNYVTVVTTDKKLYIIDADDGDIIFDRYVKKGSFGDPVVIGDKLVVLANTGRLFTFKVKELTRKKRRAKK
jgi:outer membrane protein assembly factor BamB